MVDVVGKTVGIDPSLVATGWTLIDDGGKVLAHGTVKPQATDSLDARCWLLHKRILSVLSSSRPALVVMELPALFVKTLGTTGKRSAGLGVAAALKMSNGVGAVLAAVGSYRHECAGVRPRLVFVTPVRGCGPALKRKVEGLTEHEADAYNLADGVRRVLSRLPNGWQVIHIRFGKRAVKVVQRWN